MIITLTIVQTMAGGKIHNVIDSALNQSHNVVLPSKPSFYNVAIVHNAVANILVHPQVI